jgi:hypothetical protein
VVGVVPRCVLEEREESHRGFDQSFTMAVLVLMERGCGLRKGTKGARDTPISFPGAGFPGRIVRLF